MELPLIFIVFKYVNMEWSYFKNAVKHFEAGELKANKDVTLNFPKLKHLKILASSYVVIPPISILTR